MIRLKNEFVWLTLLEAIVSPHVVQKISAIIKLVEDEQPTGRIVRIRTKRATQRLAVKRKHPIQETALTKEY